MKKLFVSASNRRGVLLLIAIVLAIVFTPRVLMFVKGQEVSKINSTARQQFLNIEQEQGFRKKSYQKKSKRFKVPPRRFNPNDYTIEQWEYLGLSEKQAAIVLKFSKRGIDNFEELSKIFVIPSDLLELMKDSLVFESTLKSAYSSERYTQKEAKQKSVSTLDLNLATELELEALPLIGEKLAQRIVKYRNRLGGFYKKEQLLEVYGIDPNTLSQIENRIQLNSDNLKKLALNRATAEELKNHPYFNWNIANSIVKLRSQNGSFKKVEDILESKLIDLEFFQKVKPYLEL